jgi:hypothetical protein
MFAMERRGNVIGVRNWPVPKIVAAVEAVTGGVALLALVLLLAFTPPFECGNDYASPATPIHSAGIALTCFVVAFLGVILATGMRLVLRRESDRRTWANRALGTSFAAAVVAGGALFAVLARWTCWP